MFISLSLTCKTYKFSKLLLLQEATCLELIFETLSKTKRCFCSQKVELVSVRFQEPHERGIRWCCKATIADPNLYKSGSMSRCWFSINRPGEIVRTAAQWAARVQTATATHFCFFQCKQSQQVSFSFNHHSGVVPTGEIGSKALLPWIFQRDQKSVRSSTL